MSRFLYWPPGAIGPLFEEHRMTSLHAAPDLSTGTDYDALASRFRPIFERIATGTAERERRELPHEAIGWLKAAGFGAVRLPASAGGAGASLPQLFRLLTELAAADSNLPQALRGHFAFVEDWLNAPSGRSARPGSIASQAASWSATHGRRPATCRSARPSRRCRSATAGSC
jgi:alkylation response protein AidB-like acyl-CoA dehydrogenase